MIYNVTSDFTRLNVTSGTIQNNSYVHSVEVSDTAQAGTGIILRPLNKFTFANQTLYVRCAQGGWAEINVVPFIVDGGGVIVTGGGGSSGGGSSGGQTVPEDQIATDEDIDSLIDDVFGGGGSSSGQTVPEDQIATDEDIDSLIDDVFGGGGSSSSQTVPEDQVATDEDIQSLIDDIFG